MCFRSGAAMAALLCVASSACVNDSSITSADLSGADFSGRDLTVPADADADADLSLADLSLADFSASSDLANPDLTFIPSDGGVTAPMFTLADTNLVGGGIIDITTNFGSLFALTKYALYRSTNDGVSWHALTLPFSSDTELAVVSGPRDIAGILYLETVAGALYRSTNNGDDFTAQSTPGSAPMSRYQQLYAAHGSGYLYYVASSSLVYRYDGSTWEGLSGLPNGSITQVTESNDNVLMINTSNDGMYALSGSTWNAIATGATGNDTRVYVLGDNNATLRVAATHPTVSIDFYSGSAWGQLASPVMSNAVAIDDNNDVALTSTTLFAFGRHAIHACTLGSGAWNDALSLPATSLTRAILPASSFYVGTDANFIFSSDGATWTARANGMHAVTTTRLVGDPTNANVVFAATNSGLFKSTDRGVTWALNASLPANAGITSFAFSGSTAYAAIDLRIFVSTDGGDTFTPVTMTPGSPISALAVSPTTANQFVFCQGKLVRVSTAGVIANATILGLTSSVACQSTVFDPNDATGMTAYVAASGTLCKSTDGGKTFAAITNANVPTSFLFLAMFKSVADVFFVGASEVDAVTGGTVVAQALPTGVTSVTDISIDPLNTDIRYLATTHGAYLSTDRGATWGPPILGLPVRTLPAVLVHPADRRLRLIAVDAGGIYRSEGTLTP